MHRLTIEHADHGTSTSSEHPDPADAQRALARYVEHADCRTDTIQMHTDFSSWDLITLGDNRVHATATIEHCSTAVAHDDAAMAALTTVPDTAPPADADERAAMQRQWGDFTVASRRFHRAS
ncbi:hypothetical protein [Mycolicibacterium mageritense]|uniref:hypothetical protein n=1 Tax=Mycolicibacterium mageritense TaxID=53462 RepID=UPI001E44F8F0|nr:hypothetical protein [Mycolicibacterium mageritense]GJJ22989.1 hypothetical protein MTY414_66620 [Mycolicibacterium mageritense]